MESLEVWQMGKKFDLKMIASTVPEFVTDEYHMDRKMVSFWDIRIFLYNHGLEYIIEKKHNRDAFFRYLKTSLETYLNTILHPKTPLGAPMRISVNRRFLAEAGTTDNEYSNWFFRRAFFWKATVKEDQSHCFGIPSRETVKTQR